ncbi:hypothetical protein HHTV1_3 [Haloarcula hispanica tailed virus 1]|uniref:Uncharacterized protein n=1 Tax=Haloarcula hispanica tailed virus 1 TaxID=1273750 RepID=R4T6D9_9CAUD|nr:hypothetical protein M198_gp03 [Haloarcula hispanica tailed virus 1]AGM11259.1 hypothetical protein HHTV1_3 [Haloarcula hispanica tailed virus 1]
MMSEDPEEPNDGFDYGERREDGQFERHPTTDQGEFVQPVRSTYIHTDGCGGATTMGADLAESFARDPHQYGKTFCASCQDYFDVTQFTWEGTDQRLDEVGPDPEADADDGVNDPQAVIETAAQEHDVDLDEAITAIDPGEESTRIYILDQQAGGDYRLISYGLDADGNAAPTEKPMQIPESAITVVQSLLHGAGMQQAHNAAADADATLRAVSEGMGITEPYLGDQ